LFGEINRGFFDLPQVEKGGARSVEEQGNSEGFFRRFKVGEFLLMKNRSAATAIE